jgi:hypothetical protein
MSPIYRNHSCRIREYTFEGQRRLFLENELLRVGIVGSAMAWSLDVFPYLWVWRNFNVSPGYPHNVRKVSHISPDGIVTAE